MGQAATVTTQAADIKNVRNISTQLYIGKVNIAFVSNC